MVMEARKWNCTAFKCRNAGCNQIFQDRASLIRHNKSTCIAAKAAQKKKNVKAFRCTIEGCGLAFVDMDELKAHVKKDHKPPIPSKFRTDGIEVHVLDK